jgi:hypothetical protein
MNSRVPLQLQWNAETGDPLVGQAHTRVVNCYGCLLVSPRELLLEQRIQLRNLANHRSNSAVVVWKGKERVDGWELGVELINPDMDFWGLEL